jgi:2-oxoglutarate dehydrogenase E1 component
LKWIEIPKLLPAAAPNAVLEQSSFLFGANAAYVEALYGQYLENSDAVDPSWRAYFASLGEEGLSATQLGRGPAWRRDAKLDLETGELTSALTGQPEPRAKGAVGEADLRAAAKESIRAIQLVRAYRVIGHLAADLDPLKLGKKTSLPQLDPNFYGFHEAELDRPIFINGVLGMESATRARWWRSSSAPIAGASATSSCTSTIPSRRTGCSGASKGPTRKSPSPRKASAPSSTS